MTDEQYAAAYTAGYRDTVRYLCNRGIRYEDALDLAQDGWLKGWVRRGQLRDPESIGGWIARISLNIYRVRLRRPDAERGATVPRHDLAGGEIDTLAMDIRTLMLMVPEHERELMRDYYVDGYSGRELGERYGANENTVKIRIMRASDKLAKSARCVKRRL